MKNIIASIVMAGLVIVSGIAAATSYDIYKHTDNTVLPLTLGDTDTVDTNSWTTTRLVTAAAPNWYVVSIWSDTDIYIKQCASTGAAAAATINCARIRQYEILWFLITGTADEYVVHKTAYPPVANHDSMTLHIRHYSTSEGRTQ